jgi:acyl phosphate:glycerol-3-phosphate acyltransferase
MSGLESSLNETAIYTRYWIVNGWPIVLGAFLVGSIPFGLIVGRFFFKTDIRAAGSGNIGAANALRTMGPGAGIAVLFLDALKGVVAVLLPFAILGRVPMHLPLLCRMCGYDPGVLSALCALAAILGHCYSPWLRFKGGKGVATFLGVIVAVSWPAALAFAAVWLAIVLSNGYASLGSIVATVVAIAIVADRRPETLFFSIPAAAIIIWKHRENISRLLAGNENRLNLLRHRDEPRVRPEGPSGGAPPRS